MAYDNEGRMTQVSYPLGGPTYDYTVDSMGRLFEIKDHSNSQVITSATYGPAGELLSLNGQGYSYNNLLQLTGMGGIQYRYSAAQNNGKISSQYDAVSGEEVTYTYDALNRLATAVTTDNQNVPQWGQSYSYDGFGNHVGQDVIKGTAPSWHTVVDPATNRSGLTDANGNKLIGGYGAARYDVENRLVGYLPDGSGADWIYDVSNQRVERRQWTNQGGDPVVTDEEIYFYSVTGQKLGNYGLTATVSRQVRDGQFVNVTTLTLAERKLNVYFGSKLIGHAPRWVDDNNNVYHTYTSVVTDRLSSIGKYYPYGQEKNPTANDTEKFATYTRDSVSGLDYANQRYYQPGFGRFLTPDPYRASGGPTDPGSWNRYSYVIGDPINLFDPHGTTYCFVNPNSGVVESCYDSVDVYASVGNSWSWSGGGGGGGALWVTDSLLAPPSFDYGWNSEGQPPPQEEISPPKPKVQPVGTYSDYVNCLLIADFNSVVQNPRAVVLAVASIVGWWLEKALPSPPLTADLSIVVSAGALAAVVISLHLNNAVECSKQTGYVPWFLQPQPH